jgi:hypothetical protein
LPKGNGNDKGCRIWQKRSLNDEKIEWVEKRRIGLKPIQGLQ